MIQLLKRLLGKGGNVNLKQIIADGATILDVRTRHEYKAGHISGSINIPLQSLDAVSVSKLTIDKLKPVVTCCASGVRSLSAKKILERHGFKVYNGGGWRSLQNKLMK